MEHNSAALPVGRWQSMLRADHIAITAEITPPLSHAEGLLDKALPLRGLVDSVNATDGAGVRAHIDSRRSLNTRGQRCGGRAIPEHRGVRGPQRPQSCGAGVTNER
jgi:hypothetical protein